MYCKVHLCKITGSNCPPSMTLIRKYCLSYQKQFTGAVKEDQALRSTFSLPEVGKKCQKVFAENFTWVKLLGKGKDQNKETTKVKITKLQT